ncbi:MAG: hypothetical protein M3N25_01090 [Actinomycetota bacterium]|nr:hypothetical protein [Actinomycetota bacterium]MDP9019393.1 hypothetical protein [Actinomycetota bacterium]
MQSPEVMALAAAVALTVVHLTAGKLRFLEGIPRSRWLSLAGGISVAYVFVHLLPELEEGQAAFDDHRWLPFLERHVWLLALAGLAVFYGLERLALTSRRRRQEEAGDDTTGKAAFRVSIGSFGLYNGLIGYLLLERVESGLVALATFAFAMAVHFVVTDYSLREHHRQAYARLGRWLVSLALVAGWAIGLAVELSPAAIAVPLAFLGGGVILNVLKEELPTERQSRFLPFLAGTSAYASLLLAV